MIMTTSDDMEHLVGSGTSFSSPNVVTILRSMDESDYFEMDPEISDLMELEAEEWVDPCPRCGAPLTYEEEFCATLCDRCGMWLEDDQDYDPDYDAPLSNDTWDVDLDEDEYY